VRRMSSDPDDVTRLVLAIAIWTAFIGSIFTMFLHGVPKGNEALISEMLTTLGSGVALVTNYYFKEKAVIYARHDGEARTPGGSLWRSGKQLEGWCRENATSAKRVVRESQSDVSAG
jgi:hypothetical protein